MIILFFCTFFKFCSVIIKLFLINMNLLQLQVSYKIQQFENLSSREPIKNPGRYFGRDITNLDQGNKQGFKEKNKSYQEDRKKKVIFNQIEDKIVNQYRRQHFASLIQNDVHKKQILMGVTQKMRMILIDWLVDVHSSFQLRQETLHLAIKILDQYLSIKQTSKAELQLVGISSLWIASKYEQIYPPKMKNFVDITANTYTKDALLEMELTILSAINFLIVKTTPYLFIKLLNLKKESLNMCQYLIQLAALEGVNKKYKDAVLVEACIKMNDFLKREKTEICLLNDRESIMQCFKDLSKILQENNKYGLKAIKRKYSKEKYDFVARLYIQLKEASF